MSSAERRERERENLRRAILDAAWELFATEDYDKISMRRIAEKIDYSATAIYLHFKDKAQLMDALAAEGYAILVSRLEVVEAADPTDRLRLLAHAYVDFALTHRPYYRLMFQYGDDKRELYGEHVERRASSGRAFEVLVSCVQGVKSSAADAVVSEEVLLDAKVLWAHIHGAVSLMMVGSRRILESDTAAFCNRAIETAIAGLLAEHGSLA